MSPNRELIGFTGAFVLFRVLVLAALGWFVGGREFTDDTPIHLWLGSHPAFPFIPHSGVPSILATGGYPPLMGLAEAIPAFVFQWLPPFFYLRLTFLIYETVAAIFFFRCAELLNLETHHRRWALGAFCFLPIGWMTTVVMAQDESIGAAFFAASLYYCLSSRWRAAVIIAGFGTVVGKIFLVLPLLAYLAAAPKSQRTRLALFGSLPIVIVYGWVVAGALINGAVVPLTGYVPSADFGVSAWGPIGDSLGLLAHVRRNLSVPLCLGLYGLFLVVGHGMGNEHPAIKGVWLSAVLLLGTMTGFYHVNPEYFILLLPAMLLLLTRTKERMAAAVLFTLPWMINFFYGVGVAIAHGEAAGGGKAAFVSIYRALFPVPPAVLYHITLWLVVVISVGTIVYLLRFGQAIVGHAALNARLPR